MVDPPKRKYWWRRALCWHKFGKWWDIREDAKYPTYAVFRRDCTKCGHFEITDSPSEAHTLRIAQSDVWLFPWERETTSCYARQMQHAAEAPPMKRKTVTEKSDWDQQMFQIAMFGVLTAIKNELDRRNEVPHAPK